ncbi:MAG: hypothetical protein Q9221_006759 [Calogaya cf. arnoldii]
MSSLEDQLEYVKTLERVLNDAKTVISADGNREPIMGLLASMLLNVSSDTTALQHAQEMQKTLVKGDQDIRTREIAHKGKVEVKLERGQARNDARGTAITARETAVAARENAITAREQTLATRERNLDAHINNQLSTGLEKLHQATKRLEGLAADSSTAESPKSYKTSRTPNVLQRPRVDISSQSDDLDELTKTISPTQIRDSVFVRPVSNTASPSKRRYHALSTNAISEEAKGSKRARLETQLSKSSTVRDSRANNSELSVHFLPESLQDPWKQLTLDIGKEDQKELVNMLEKWIARKTLHSQQPRQMFTKAANSKEHKLPDTPTPPTPPSQGPQTTQLDPEDSLSDPWRRTLWYAFANFGRIGIEEAMYDRARYEAPSAHRDKILAAEKRGSHLIIHLLGGLTDACIRSFIKGLSRMICDVTAN